MDLQHSQGLPPTIVPLLRWREMQEWLSSSLGVMLSFPLHNYAWRFVKLSWSREGTYVGTVPVLHEVAPGPTRTRMDKPVYKHTDSGFPLTHACAPVHLCRKQKGEKTASRLRGSFSPILATEIRQLPWL